jgi:hypothetical protein
MTMKKRSEENLPGSTENSVSKNMIGRKPKADTAAMHDLLGEKLRAHYDAVAREPVPDRFEKLLEELDTHIKSKK